MDPGFTVADPLTARLLLDRAWTAWLPEALSEPGAADAVREAIERGLGLERLRDLAFALVDGARPARRPAGASALRRARGDLNADARATIVRLADLRARRREGSGGPARRGRSRTWRSGCSRPRACRRLTRRGRCSGRRGCPTSPERLGNKTKWRDKAALEECRAGLDRAPRARGGRAAVGPSQPGRRPRSLGGGLRRRLTAVAKARAGCLDFLDLSSRARNLVRDRADVRQDFQRGIRYLLVDEFQDTDPLQLEMVLCLAEGAPPGSLFVVGDPKQSIYRFRRADIETYEEAKRTLAEPRRGPGDPRELPQLSRRSWTPSTACSKASWSRRPTAPISRQYVALEPSPRTQAGAPPAVLALAAGRAVARWRERGGGPGGAAGRRVPPPRGRVGGRFRYGDVALLFRAMTNVVAYEDALRAAGIPFRTVGGRALLRPVGGGLDDRGAGGDRGPARSRSRWSGALRSPFFGVTDEALLGLHLAGASSAISGRSPSARTRRLARRGRLLGALHRDRNAAAPAAVVERLLAGSEVAGRLRARAPGRGAGGQSPEGPRHGAGARGDRRAHLPRARPVAPGSRSRALRGGGVRGRRRRRGPPHDDPQGQGPRVSGRRRARPRARWHLAAPISWPTAASGRLAVNLGRAGRHDDDHARLGRRRGRGDPAGGCRGAARPLRRPHARRAGDWCCRCRRSRRATASTSTSSRSSGRRPDVLTADELDRPGRVRRRAPPAAAGASGDARRLARASAGPHRARRASPRRQVPGRARARGPAVPRAARASAPRRRRSLARRSVPWISAAPHDVAGRGRRARGSTWRPTGGRRRGGSAARGGAGGSSDRARAAMRPGSGATCPVAVEVAGRVQEDTLDLVFEEAGELVVVSSGRRALGAGRACAPGDGARPRRSAVPCGNRASSA